MNSSAPEIENDRDVKAEGRFLKQVVVFELGDQAFAADVRNVREIIRLEEVRPIPQTPKALLGVSTIRGEILPVIDLAEYLKIQSDLPGEQKKLIVLEFAGQKTRTGIAVDNVRRIYNITEDQLDYSLQGSFMGENLTCVIKQDGENILVPDFIRIIEAFRLETLRLSQEAARVASCEEEDGEEPSAE